MRIVAGAFRSRILVAPKGEQTRPTTDRARESLFNVLVHLTDLTGASVLDLFAGSGALGFEALSRGAERVVFVEQNRQAISAIKANAETLGVADRIHVVQKDCYAYLITNKDSFDVILSDAPYEDHRALSELASLLSGKAPVIAIEHRTGDSVTVSDSALLLRELKAGEASFTILGRRPSDPGPESLTE